MLSLFSLSSTPVAGLDLISSLLEHQTGHQINQPNNEI